MMLIFMCDNVPSYSIKKRNKNLNKMSSKDDDVANLFT